MKKKVKLLAQLTSSCTLSMPKVRFYLVCSFVNCILTLVGLRIFFLVIWANLWLRISSTSEFSHTKLKFAVSKVKYQVLASTNIGHFATG